MLLEHLADLAAVASVVEALVLGDDLRRQPLEHRSSFDFERVVEDRRIGRKVAVNSHKISGEALKVDSSIAPRTEVEAGTGMVTSGVDRSAFPPGIPVGKVTATAQGAGGLALELTLEPLVDVDQLSYVTVLQWQVG